MTKFYRVTATVPLNIRTGPGQSYLDIGDLLKDDVIEVSETLGGWHHITAIKAVPVTNPDSWCAGAYTVEIASPTPDPDPEPTPEPPTVGPITVTVESEFWETVVVKANPKQ